MITLEDNFEKVFENSTYIALGSFDGLHLGHISLVNDTITLAKKNHSLSMVVTFKNHPLTVINEEIAPKQIISNAFKAEILQKSGIDILNFMTFSDSFMKMSPEDFIKNLLSHYKAKGLIVGFNYRFGYKNLGDVDLLKKMSKELGFELHVIEPVKIGRELVSSSSIRAHISEGNMEKASKLLGRLFMLDGEVVKGKQLGRTIGFPTINLDYCKSYILPSGGVYFTYVEYNNKFYKGITNIGYNPTVEGKKLSIETYILNFDENIYGNHVRIFFRNKFRDEKKFNSLEELIAQLKKDKIYAEKQNLKLNT